MEVKIVKFAGIPAWKVMYLSKIPAERVNRKKIDVT